MDSDLCCIWTMAFVFFYIIRMVAFHQTIIFLIRQTGLLCIMVSCLMPTSVSQRAAAGCQLSRPQITGFSRLGEITIGGIFPVHDDRTYPETTFTERPAELVCQLFGLQNYQWLQAMVFAIEEINRSPDLLPNITLGFRIYDSCEAVQWALEGTLWILTQEADPVLNYQCHGSLPVVAVIGDSSSTRSILMARILGLHRYPQISYFSTSPLLSDRIQFPSFFRTIPSDDFQSRGLAQLLIHFGWTWVGLLTEDTDYGQQGAQILQEALDKTGTCIAFSENILTNVAHRNAVHIIQVIKNSTAMAIVTISNDANLVPIMDELVRQNVTGKTWIASEAWSTSPLLSRKKYAGILAGTIGFAIHRGEMSGFKEHLNQVHPSRSPDNALITRFWEEAFGCKWLDQKIPQSSWGNQTRLCTGAEKLDSLQIIYNDVKQLRVTYNVYSAVYAIASALHDLNSCNNGGGPFHNGSCADLLDFQPWQVLHYVKNVRFRNADGTEVFFDKSGNPPAQYDVINWQLEVGGTLKQIKLGSYGSSAPLWQSLTINSSAAQWAGGGAQIPLSVCSPSCPPGSRKAGVEGEPACCFQCVQCPQGEISNHTDSIVCSKCPMEYWPNQRQDRCLQKEIEFLSYEEPLGASLAAIGTALTFIPSAILGLFILNNNTPIIKANNRVLSYVLLLALAMCFLCSLPFVGNPSPRKCLLRQAAFGISFALCISCILAKTIMVVIAFNATKPNSDLRRWVGPKLSYTVISVGTLIQVLLCASWLILAPPFPESSTHTQPGKIIVECNEGSPIAFWCMLGYLGLLASICFLVAFLARKLPDSFNEAKFITFSMLAFLSVWLSFIPAYLSTRGKYMVAMEIFAILSSGSSLLFCIFLPKCYIIIFRPEMNTKEYLMGRGAANKCD